MKTVKTLLESFIAKKVDSAQGEKYFISLVCALTNFRLVDIAQFHKISYGTLRNWTTQESFQKMMDDNRCEFIAYMKTRLTELITFALNKNNLLFVTSSYLRDSLEFQDYFLYNSNLIERIDKEGKERLKEIQRTPAKEIDTSPRYLIPLFSAGFLNDLKLFWKAQTGKEKLLYKVFIKKVC
jgi:hypothetical protein